MIRIIYYTQCRDCTWWYYSRVKPTGSKWTSLCGSCIRNEI